MDHSVGRRGVHQLPDATPHNPANDSPKVDLAYAAILAAAKSPHELRRRQALWVLVDQCQDVYRALTPQETVAVLLRFPGRGDR